jgi:hypothetical protein
MKMSAYLGYHFDFDVLGEKRKMLGKIECFHIVD